MSSASTSSRLLEDAQKLAKSIDAEADSGRSGSLPLARRHELFSNLAAMRNSAEAVGDLETCTLLDEKRTSLKLPRKAQTSAQKLSMYLRMGTTLFVAMYGALCMLFCVPLRVIHPPLRQMGVPNGCLPLDLLLTLWTKAVLWAAGVKVKLEGSRDWADRTDLVGIIVYNHTSNLDPFIINAMSYLYGPKFIGKKVLFNLPILGWLFILIGYVPINRGNREKAVATMNDAVCAIMQKWGRSVSISPEGTRSTDGFLRLPFKKGVFHVQDKTKVPLLPIVIEGAYELWPPGRLFTDCGEVTVSFMPPQPIASGDDSSIVCEALRNPRDASRLALQKSYVEYMQKRSRKAAKPLSWAATLECLGCLALVFLGFWYASKGMGALFSALGLGYKGVSILFGVTTVGMALFVEKCL